MFVEVDGTRVAIRPLWRAFLLSFFTGSGYQAWWAWRAARDLSGLRVRGASRMVAWPLAIAAGQVGVVAIAATSQAWMSSGWLVVGACCLLAATWAVSDIADAIGTFHGTHQSPGGARAGTVAAIALLLTGLGIAVAGVQPQDGLDAQARITSVLASGLVLPFWLLYLQHALNQALLPFGPRTAEERQFGQLASGQHAAGAMIRARLSTHQRARAMSERLDILPVVTLGLVALCTATWLWQAASFGLNPSLAEMSRSGAASRLLAEGDGWWRLVTQNFIHFSVDHWAFNMFITCLAGWMVERALGHRRTAITMLAAMVGCTAVSWWGQPILYGPGADSVVSGGESGIAFGLIGALVAIDPAGRGPIGRFGRWMAVIGAVNSLAPGVGLLAHAGGFAGGYAVTRLLLRYDAALAADVSATVAGEPPAQAMASLDVTTPMSLPMPLPPPALPATLPPPVTGGPRPPG